MKVIWKTAAMVERHVIAAVVARWCGCKGSASLVIISSTTRCAEEKVSGGIMVLRFAHLSMERSPLKRPPMEALVVRIRPVW